MQAEAYSGMHVCGGLEIIHLVNKTKKEHSTCGCNHLVVWPMLVSGALTG